MSRSTPVPGSPWQSWPEAEQRLQDWIEHSLEALPEAGRFVRALEAATSTRVLDWVDHVMVGADASTAQELGELGFEPEAVRTEAGMEAWHHPGAQLPRVLVQRREGGSAGVAAGAAGFSLKCDRVADVLLANGLDRTIRGAPRAPLREAVLFEGDGVAMKVTERCGYRGYEVVDFPADAARHYEQAKEIWAGRGRWFADDAEGMRTALASAERMAAMVGQDAAAWLAFEVERDYWQRHNRAGQVQKARQDRMGFGWANHDHHTFRSSRVHFKDLLAVLHVLGFVDRERFYAGAEAGWGAQILEQPACGLVVFADVDLMPEEIDIDFARERLRPWDQLGTIGLWCGLHGESMLSAGMHHLEAQFEFEELRAALGERGVGMMQPFSDMTELRQAFTEGERWPVRRQRLARLVEAGLIEGEQAERFAQEGAVGSHLENLQRRYGFKGFNSKNVSDIIGRTDPRRLA